MKIEHIDHGPALGRIEAHSIGITGRNFRLSIYEDDRNGEVQVTIDPLGQDYIARLDNAEVSASDMQVRIRTRGVRIGELPDLAFGTIAAEVQNIIDKESHNRLDTTARLSALTTLRDFVLGMKPKR